MKKKAGKAKYEYVCTVCGGIADHAKNCGTPGCRLEGTPLKKREKK